MSKNNNLELLKRVNELSIQFLKASDCIAGLSTQNLEQVKKIIDLENRVRELEMDKDYRDTYSQEQNEKN